MGDPVGSFFSALCKHAEKSRCDPQRSRKVGHGLARVVSIVGKEQLKHQETPRGADYSPASAQTISMTCALR